MGGSFLPDGRAGRIMKHLRRNIMSSAGQSGKTLKISDSLNRQLNAYALVASAAGVSVLALAGPSEAKVVYTETHQVTRAGVPLYIDLNHDGINDFVLRTTIYAGSSGFEARARPIRIPQQRGCRETS